MRNERALCVNIYANASRCGYSLKPPQGNQLLVITKRGVNNRTVPQIITQVVYTWGCASTFENIKWQSNQIIRYNLVRQLSEWRVYIKYIYFAARKHLFKNNNYHVRARSPLYNTKKTYINSIRFSCHHLRINKHTTFKSIHKHSVCMAALGVGNGGLEMHTHTHTPFTIVLPIVSHPWTRRACSVSKLFTQMYLNGADILVASCYKCCLLPLAGL